MANIRSRTPIPLHQRPDYDGVHSETRGGPGHQKFSTARRDSWQRMADTCAWVEYQCAVLDSRHTETEKWVLEQQAIYPSLGYPGNRSRWNDTVFKCGGGGVRWMRDRERVEDRIRRRLDMEKQSKATGRRDKMVRDAWQRYEEGWKNLANSNRIWFSEVPWPVAGTPMTLEEITPREIEYFLLSPLHSEGQSAKERIRRAQLRWHPDRFQGFLSKADSRDKELVEAGAGAVARCLNDVKARVE
ncbi:hypothetical protein GGX14DRAFT_439152 [Mycena pura]|uniref:J domain-containing protein n=1 Tax=Mycena pura TaxID=153505 RepID=A0AAD6VVG9_9AGAR|nr:hypothetical protein GGX14DRAFT_439152 [Mycena pura]